MYAMHDAVHTRSTYAPLDVALGDRRAYVAVGKRALDLFGSVFGLVVLAPVLGLIALVIRIDSSGSPIYRQRRLGLRGAPFEMYKFRTMYTGNDPEAHRRYVSRLILEGSTELQNGSGGYKLENDPRITRVGAVLRRLSLDELPQLLNVLRGEMSLVGPRPPLEYEAELYTARQHGRLDAVPGMTGLWQVSGRNSTTFEEMIDLDLSYIAGRSLRGDLGILVRTVSVVREAGGA
jgi:lipopolysaccharide/colanic/teichoic acid biosynthesis glycosyltransferase